MKPKHSFFLFAYFLILTIYLLDIDIAKSIVISLSGTASLFLIRSLPKQIKGLAYASYGFVFLTAFWFTIQQVDRVFQDFGFYL